MLVCLEDKFRTVFVMDEFSDVMMRFKDLLKGSKTGVSCQSVLTGTDCASIYKAPHNFAKHVSLCHSTTVAHILNSATQSIKSSTKRKQTGWDNNKEATAAVAKKEKITEYHRDATKPNNTNNNNDNKNNNLIRSESLTEEYLQDKPKNGNNFINDSQWEAIHNLMAGRARLEVVVNYISKLIASKSPEIANNINVYFKNHCSYMANKYKGVKRHEPQAVRWDQLLLLLLELKNKNTVNFKHSYKHTHTHTHTHHMYLHIFNIIY
jgi:hypothetical protein